MYKPKHLVLNLFQKIHLITFIWVVVVSTTCWLSTNKTNKCGKSDNNIKLKSEAK